MSVGQQWLCRLLVWDCYLIFFPLYVVTFPFFPLPQIFIYAFNLWCSSGLATGCGMRLLTDLGQGSIPTQCQNMAHPLSGIRKWIQYFYFQPYPAGGIWGESIAFSIRRENRKPSNEVYGPAVFQSCILEVLCMYRHHSGSFPGCSGIFSVLHEILEIPDFLEWIWPLSWGSQMQIWRHRSGFPSSPSLCGLTEVCSPHVTLNLEEKTLQIFFTWSLINLILKIGRIILFWLLV